MHGVDKWVEVRAAYAAGKKIKQIVRELEVLRGFARSVIRAETADATYAKRSANRCRKWQTSQRG